MMKMRFIQSQQIISTPIEQAETFMEQMKEAIKAFQDKGLEVEVQFTTTVSRFSVLILAYSKEG